MTLGDFVKYLTLLLQKNGVILPFNKQALWHKLFYKLKKETGVIGKPAFLEELWFDWDGPYPKSPELSEFLHALCWNGVVETTSPRFENYTLSEGMERLLQQRFEELDETMKQYLNLVVGIAREEFSNVVNRA